MAKTMKAAVVHEFKQPLRIEEVPVPTPGAGQIVVKIAATGVDYVSSGALTHSAPNFDVALDIDA